MPLIPPKRPTSKTSSLPVQSEKDSQTLQDEDDVCVACGGSGVASNGSRCTPCRGSGTKHWPIVLKWLAGKY